MWRYQGHSMPGFGCGFLIAVLTLVVASALSADLRLWQAGLIGLGAWVVIDVLSLVSLKRKERRSK